jgi:hypothetical protein
MQRIIKYLNYLFYRIAYGKHPRSKKWMLFTDLKNETAEELAEERRKIINSLIGENSIMEYEFLESPRNYKVKERQRIFFENRDEMYGQMARLKWQLNSTEYLLIERLTDLVIILIRDNKESISEYPLIKLEPIDKFERKKGNFIWKAIIEADNLGLYFDFLFKYKEWIGIPVELREKKYYTIKQNGHCSNSIEEGTVGGHIVYNNVEYSMTCSHVLAPDCGSVLFRGNRNSTSFNYQNHVYQAPDAALIDINSPCFRITKSNKQFLSIATEQVYITAADNRVVLNKNPESYPKKNGYISNPGTLMPMVKGTAYRFPHVSVRLIQKKYLFGLLKFPMNSHFSVGGNSGSWVIDTNTNIWYGMVIGSDDVAITYLIQCEPLLDFFKYQIGGNNSLKMTPFFYS